MKHRVWVIAGAEYQYHDYVKSKPLNGDKKYSYVYAPDTLRGFINPHGVFVGTWRHRHDIIPILDQLIISTNENTDKLHKIRIELMQNASHTQTQAAIKSAGIARAAGALANAIDQELMDQLIGKPKVVQTVFDIMEEYDQPMTWKGFVK